MNRCFILIATFACLSACSLSNNQEILQQSQQISSAALSTHNRLRAFHHADALTWDDQLALYAGKHAALCRFQHSHGPYGENLAMGYDTFHSVAKAWYDENAKYNYAKPGFSFATGHFTQMVWKSTRKVGCAYADCNGKHGTIGKMWVCEYSPAGNIINPGFFAKNVLPS